MQHGDGHQHHQDAAANSERVDYNSHSPNNSVTSRLLRFCRVWAAWQLSLFTARMLNGLTLPDEPADLREEDRARSETVVAAVTAIEATRHDLPAEQVVDADLYTNASVRVRADYKHRIDETAPGTVAAEYICVGPTMRR